MFLYSSEKRIWLPEQSLIRVELDCNRCADDADEASERAHDRDNDDLRDDLISGSLSKSSIVRHVQDLLTSAGLKHTDSNNFAYSCTDPAHLTGDPVEEGPSE